MFKRIKSYFAAKDKVCGTSPSPEDKRDYEAKDLLMKQYKYPDVVDYRSVLPRVRNQKDFGTCSAFAAAVMKEYQEKLDKKREHISTWFIYNQRSNLPSEGMYPRDTMKILIKNGSVKEEQYPYKPIYHNNQVPQYLIEKGLAMKIKSYAKIRTVEELKEALYENGPCYGALLVRSFNRPDFKFWKARKDGTQSDYGGHAISIVGYNKKGFIIRNSWGPRWANKGYVIMPYYDFNEFIEVWTTIG